LKKLKDYLSNKKWYRILSFCILPLYLLFCLGVLEYMNFSSLKSVLSLWYHHPLRLVFSYMVILLISAVILLISKKVWLFAAISGTLSIILGIINCVKLAINGDYFFPWDVSMAGNMGQLIGFAKFDLPILLWPAIAFVVLVSFALWCADIEIPLKWYYRLPSTLVFIIPIIVLYNTPKTTEKLLNKFTMSFENSVLQSSNYKYNGFTNAFTINCFALKVVAPDEYSETYIAQSLKDYTSSKTQSQTPDVIVVMSEAFTDIRELKNTTFSQNPLVNYDEIRSRENAVSGNIYTTAHGGGTVRTEFEVITGLTIDYLVNGTSPYLYVTRDLESYVSNYKNQGYKTTGIHTYDGKFYMRNEAYPLLGFDEFIAQDAVVANYDEKYRRGYIIDDVFMDVVIDTLEKNTDTPNFIYGITMENHGAYDKSKEENIIVKVQNDRLDQAQLDSVTTYTQGVYYADLSLKKLVDYVDSREKPTVVVFFGDHKPALGAYHAAYNQAGNVNISDGYDTEENKCIYSAQYLIYSNYDVDYGVLEQNTDISTYYLLTLIAKATGTNMTPYMQYLYDHFGSLPYYNVRLQMPLDKQNQNFITLMKNITYDRVKGKGYSNTK